jgi:hypothetical protein
MRYCAFVSLSLFVVAACSSSGSDDVDLGDDKVDRVASSLEDYEGQWVGYAEAYEFESDSDKLVITLNAQGEGTVVFGDAQPVEPFTDPDVGYPPIVNMFPSASYDYDGAHAGFGYPVHDAVVESGRIRFKLWGTDLVSDWCAAQTSYYDDENLPAAYTCSPTGRAYGQNAEGCREADGSEPMTVYDCGLIKTCLAACTCDETSCTGERRAGRELELDGALDAANGDLVGTIVIEDERITVRLTRQ